MKSCSVREYEVDKKCQKWSDVWECRHYVVCLSVQTRRDSSVSTRWRSTHLCRNRFSRTTCRYWLHTGAWYSVDRPEPERLIWRANSLSILSSCKKVCHMLWHVVDFIIFSSRILSDIRETRCSSQPRQPSDVISKTKILPFITAMAESV